MRIVTGFNETDFYGKPLDWVLRGKGYEGSVPESVLLLSMHLTGPPAQKQLALYDLKTRNNRLVGCQRNGVWLPAQFKTEQLPLEEVFLAEDVAAILTGAVEYFDRNSSGLLATAIKDDFAPLVRVHGGYETFNAPTHYVQRAQDDLEGFVKLLEQCQ